MDVEALDEEWGVLVSLLPPGWRDWAREEKAFQRARGIPTADALLRVLLMHAGSGLSLKQTVARAQLQQIATVSAPAIHIRLAASGAWLNRITTAMIARGNVRMPTLLPSGRRLRTLDATTISEPGSTGTDWRIHYSLSLPSLRCDYFEVTDPKVGESYDNIPVERGDIVLADRGYCHREAVAALKERGGDVIVRLALGNFPLRHPDGSPFEVLPMLRKLRGRKPREWEVVFETKGPAGEIKRHAARFCAIRKSRRLALRDQERLRKQRRKKGRSVQPGTLESTAYVFVLATVPESDLSVEQVLELYRARWQVELCFKRLKSLLSIGHVPKNQPDTARAWIQAKLLTAVLIERLQDKARFSPWGFDALSAQHVA